MPPRKIARKAAASKPTPTPPSAAKEESDGTSSVADRGLRPTDEDDVHIPDIQVLASDLVGGHTSAYQEERPSSVPTLPPSGQ